MVVPTSKHSEIVTNLLEHEIKKREQKLYKTALAVEKDQQLHEEMQEWDVALVL